MACDPQTTPPPSSTVLCKHNVLIEWAKARPKDRDVGTPIQHWAVLPLHTRTCVCGALCGPPAPPPPPAQQPLDATAMPRPNACLTPLVGPRSCPNDQPPAKRRCCTFNRRVLATRPCLFFSLDASAPRQSSVCMSFCSRRPCPWPVVCAQHVHGRPAQGEGGGGQGPLVPDRLLHDAMRPRLCQTNTTFLICVGRVWGAPDAMCACVRVCVCVCAVPVVCVCVCGGGQGTRGSEHQTTSANQAP